MILTEFNDMNTQCLLGENNYIIFDSVKCIHTFEL